jgi:Methyltransferase domain
LDIVLHQPLKLVGKINRFKVSNKRSENQDMLNRLLRYAPVVGFLKSNSASDGFLEVGSGALGVGEFLNRSFVGLDVRFVPPFSKSILPIRATSVALPFKENSFDTVVCLDTLEHVEPTARMELISELVRVTKNRLIVGFPFGDRARKVDSILHNYHTRRHLPVPDWLSEHLQFAYPDDQLMSNRNDFKIVKMVGNENAWWHLFVMVAESYRGINRLTSKLSRLGYIGLLIGRVLSKSSLNRSYRRIYVVQKSRQEVSL